jgi:hypothetical protein
VQINTITPNYAYYNIFQLTLRYEYLTILFFHKTYVRYIRNYCSTHNFEGINIITPNYVYYKIVKLTLQYEYHRTIILHKT